MRLVVHDAGDRFRNSRQEGRANKKARDNGAVYCEGEI